ncbi:MAG: hypothetical protein K2W79_03815 [Hydrotalea flava]|nr:hypothetical protein [Hydrotalea flava]
MKQLSFLSLVFVFLACASGINSPKDVSNDFKHLSLFSDSLKLLIRDSCKQKFASNYFFGLKLTKLNRSTILNIEPIRDQSYINENGYPFEYFEEGDCLFLVYCGIESIKENTEEVNSKIISVFKAYSKKHGIDSIRNKVDDKPTLFFKIDNNKITSYPNAYTKEFSMTFYEIKEEMPKYNPK